MKQLIVPPLMINLIMFIIGSVYGINPSLVSNTMIISNPGGYVYQIQINAVVFSILAGIIVTASVLGIRVLGSGVADASISLVVRAIIYSIIWCALSVFTLGFLSLIPTFGYIIYAIISIMFAIGVIIQLADQDNTPQKIEKEGGDE